MSTWGESWGAWWGNTWGAIDTAAPKQAPIAGPDDDLAEALDAQRDRIRKQNNLILMTVIAAVTGGVIE